MGRWLDVYGESIYGSEPTADRLRISSAGRTHTKIGNTLYLHCWRWPGEEIVVGGVGGRILSARLLGSDTPVSVEQRGHRVWLRGLPAYAPDPIDTVIALEFDGPAPGARPLRRRAGGLIQQQRQPFRPTAC